MRGHALHASSPGAPRCEEHSAQRLNDEVQLIDREEQSFELGEHSEAYRDDLATSKYHPYVLHLAVSANIKILSQKQ
jgi:hypothetical protein